VLAATAADPALLSFDFLDDEHHMHFGDIATHQGSGALTAEYGIAGATAMTPDVAVSMPRAAADPVDAEDASRGMARGGGGGGGGGDAAEELTAADSGGQRSGVAGHGVYPEGRALGQVQRDDNAAHDLGLEELPGPTAAAAAAAGAEGTDRIFGAGGAPGAAGATGGGDRHPAGGGLGEAGAAAPVKAEEAVLGMVGDQPTHGSVQAREEAASARGGGEAGGGGRDRGTDRPARKRPRSALAGLFSAFAFAESSDEEEGGEGDGVFLGGHGGGDGGMLRF
jgi:hypothetical protein